MYDRGGDRPKPPGQNISYVVTPFLPAIRGSVSVRSRLVGRIGSRVRVSASFPKNSPPDYVLR